MQICPMLTFRIVIYFGVLLYEGEKRGWGVEVGGGGGGGGEE